MPDWTYRTLIQPVLVQIPFPLARQFAFRCLGGLAGLPGGGHIIDFMGHMRAEDGLQTRVGNVLLNSPIGLGPALDPQGHACLAFSRFGFGFLELGPVQIEQAAPQTQDELDQRSQLLMTQMTPQLSVHTARRRSQDLHARGMPVLIRLPEFPSVANPTTEKQRILQGHLKAILRELANQVAGFTLHESWLPEDQALHEPFLRELRAIAGNTLLLLVVGGFPSAVTKGRIHRIVDSGLIDGLVVSGATRDHGQYKLGLPLFETTCQATAEWSQELGPDFPLIATGGVHEPASALRLLLAGARCVQLDSGLIFAGPGLAKRCNEAIQSQLPVEEKTAGSPSMPAAREAWFWSFLMGFSMLVGGLMALVIGATRVLLPYDEAAVGLTRQQLLTINSRLISFMSHDRVTLAGTMLSVGILYLALACWGSRRGAAWAQRAINISAMVGFLTFFLFLGFGYFDSFHAFVSSILFQFLVLSMHAPVSPRGKNSIPDLHNDATWQLGLWGQLLFVIHGAVLLVAGSIISTFGVTTVFVPEDLEFMETTAEELIGAHPRLVPLVAHDRATFGGMLIACGIAVLLASLWGFSRGRAWMWWALMSAGTVAYLTTISVHWIVGYDSLKHLLPAYFGLFLLWVAGIVAQPYLCARRS